MSAVTTWKCEVCGYIHRGEAPPAICPVCGVGAEMFSPFELAPQPRPSDRAAGRGWRCTICDYVHEGDPAPGHCPVCGAAQTMFEPQGEPLPATIRQDVERVVILGGGVAGLTAAEAARQAAPEVAITLIAKEPHPPYYRLNLTRLLAGEISEDALAIKDARWFAEQRIELRLGTEAIGIDRQRQEVRLADGSLLPYDRLILANGAHPFVPPLAGGNRQGVLPLRSLADAQQLSSLAGSARRCVCLGGGLLGLEVAGALARKGLQVTVVEGFDWLLPRQLAEPAGHLLQARLEQTGLQVICGTTAEELLGDEGVRAVRLANGQELPAELVVLSAGVRPNSYLARQAGLEVKRGVVVDDHLFTSDPAILAAGDVCEHRGVAYGIWPAAYAQGLIAGTNAVGGQLEFHGLAPSTQLKVVAVDLVSIGQFIPPDASYQVLEHEEGEQYLRLVCRDGMLVGANLLGDISLANTIREAVESGAQLATLSSLIDRLPQVATLCATFARSA